MLFISSSFRPLFKIATENITPYKKVSVILYAIYYKSGLPKLPKNCK